MTRWAVPVACAAAFTIGLFFVFVWAPHPWGWNGFDNYHDLGLALARGGPFPTIDQPWGYAYFLAAFYRVFGDRPILPLLVQVALNASLPLLVFAFARTEFDERVATVAALLTGFFSFNTVYASTQSSDSVCTVIFMSAVVLFARARRLGDDWRLYASAGLLLGVAPQFRPNLILVPVLLAVYLVAERRSVPRMRGAVMLVVTAALVLLPWVIRNERLTGEPLPTSTHGGVQLWYGTLQTGEYLTSRSYNPRAAFEVASFPYTSLDRVPIVVSGRVLPCAADPPHLVYWTDRDGTRRRVGLRLVADGTFEATIPRMPSPTVVYYFVANRTGRETAPEVFFVSSDHLGDLDRHADLLDTFDVVRLMRDLAWNEPDAEAAGGRIDLDGDGKLTEADLQIAVATLLRRAKHSAGAVMLEREDQTVSLRFADGSTLAVPRSWSGRITDITVTGEAADALIHAWVPFARLRPDGGCAAAEDLAANRVFYRSDPNAMRRYLALAFDNIRRDPAAFAASAAYRAVRVFVLAGSDDSHTAFQFSGSGRIYRAGWIASTLLLALFVAGVIAARRRGAAIALPLLLIAYIPATLAFVLTNMRYSITVQPLMFMFVAAAIVSASEAAAAGRHRAGSETAHQP